MKQQAGNQIVMPVSVTASTAAASAQVNSIFGAAPPASI